jgi:HEAT repeat protein
MKLADRYGSLFGYSVETDGTAIIPFSSLQSLAGSQGGFSLFLATMTSPNLPVMPGGGFGRLPGNGSLDMSAEVIAPVGPKERGAVVVILPSLTPQSGASHAPRHIWFEYVAGNPQQGDSLLGGVMHEEPASVDRLVQDIRNDSLPPWRRRFALNWLVEDHPTEAEPIVLEVLSRESGRSLFTSAIADAGMLKARGAVTSLSRIVASTHDTATIALAIAALAMIGDVSAAPAIRPLIAATNAELSRTAILALGALRDSSSVSALMAVFNRSKDFRSNAAATALVQIGEQASIAELLRTIDNTRASETARRAATQALSPGLAQSHVDQLARIMTNSPRAYGLASDAAEALGRASDSKALAALLAASESGNDQVADLAIKELTRNEMRNWREAVIRLASSAQAKYRRKAIFYLGVFKVALAAPTIREATASIDPEIKRAACSALESMHEAKPADCP